MLYWNAWIQISALLLVQFLADVHSGSQHILPQVLGSLSPTCEARNEFWVPWFQAGLGLTVAGIWRMKQMKNLSPFVSLKIKFTKSEILFKKIYRDKSMKDDIKRFSTKMLKSINTKGSQTV